LENHENPQREVILRTDDFARLSAHTATLHSGIFGGNQKRRIGTMAPVKLLQFRQKCVTAAVAIYKRRRSAGLLCAVQ
jgi:hypothetical protein